MSADADFDEPPVAPPPLEQVPEREVLPEISPLGDWVQGRGFQVRGNFLQEEPKTVKMDFSRHPTRIEMTGVWGRREVLTAGKLIELSVYRLRSARSTREKEEAADDQDRAAHEAPELPEDNDYEEPDAREEPVTEISHA